MNQRVPVLKIKEEFPQLKYNPFRDRIYRVFSSYKDDCFSFEDMLDFCSVMSDKCPDDVKAVWAFRIFDFEEDGQLDEGDVSKWIDRLTQGLDRDRVIPDGDKKRIATLVRLEFILRKLNALRKLK